MAMTTSQKEIYRAVCMILRDLKPMANKPDANIGPAYQEFDSLLVKAKQHFSGSEIIKGMEPLAGATTIVHYVSKLSALRAGIEAVIPWDEREGD